MTIQLKLKDIIFWGAVTLAVIAFLNTCKGGFLGGLFGGKKTDTISVKTDTVWVIERADTAYIPVPQKITNTIYTPLYKTDTLEITEVLPADTAAILSRFYQKVFYSDTQLNKYGKIIIDDTVYQNRISSRRLQTHFTIPEVTNTVTLERKKNVVYLGVNAVGTPTKPLYAIGGDLSLKNITDKIYSIGAFTNISGDIYYQAGFKVPIRLTKKR